MSTNIRRRCPAPWPGVRTPRLALEALEPRCACAAGRVNPTGAILPGRPAEGLVAVVAQQSETVIVTARAKGLTFTPRAGAPFTGSVAQVNLEPASQDAAAAYFANIWWGNGQSTAGVIQPAGQGGYDVIGSMTYSDPGDYQVMIELAGPDGARVTAVSLAHVEPAAKPDIDAVPPAPEVDPKGQDNPDPPAGTPEEPTPTAGGRTPNDTSGAVPWLRLPDPRPDPAAPASPEVARNDPPPATGPAVPPPAAVGPPPPGGGDAPVDDTVGPAYLTAAGEPPAEYSGVPAVDAAPTALRPTLVAGDGGALVVLAGPAADVDLEGGADGPPPAAMAAAAAGTVAVPPPDDPGRRQRGGLWWKSLTWCVALIFTERMVAARAADRRPPRLPVT